MIESPRRSRVYHSACRRPSNADDYMYLSLIVLRQENGGMDRSLSRKDGGKDRGLFLLLAF